MSQLDSSGDLPRQDEDGHCVSRDLIKTMSHTRSNLAATVPFHDATEQHCDPARCADEEANSFKKAGSPDFDGSNGSLSQTEVAFSLPVDVASALRSVAFPHTWDLWKVLFPLSNLFSVPEVDEIDDGTSLDRDENGEGFADLAEEDVPTASFISKYIHGVPLYQDYILQSIKADLSRVDKGFLSELVTPECLPGLQASPAPRPHVDVTLREPAPLQAAASSPSSCALRVSPCTRWQDLDEVKERGLLGTLREIRLQEAMFEVITSEASYLRSLEIAVNHFYASQTLERTISQTEHRVLFSNLRHVMAASEKFLVDLEDRLGENVFISEVGDIVLQHCPTFRALYVTYVTNMMYQEALVTQLLQKNRGFACAVKKLERDPVCQRQNLKSFLVLPFQRITRLKLLLETILRLTDPDSGSVSNLKTAIEAICKIVIECDQRVCEMKRIEELVFLDMMLDFGKIKTIPLVVNGRFLVHKGPLKQLIPAGAHRARTAFIDVFFHLFNDLLIISLKREKRFSVVDHAEYPAHVHVEQVRMDVLGLPSTTFVLRLSRNHSGLPTVMVLATNTKLDKEAWTKALSSRY